MTFCKLNQTYDLQRTANLLGILCVLGVSGSLLKSEILKSTLYTIKCLPPHKRLYDKFIIEHIQSCFGTMMLHFMTPILP